LADFGGAEIIEKSKSGSLAFNSPELLLGYDPRYSHDIWAFGVTLVELWSGVQPFDVQGVYSRLEGDLIQLRLIEVFCNDEIPSECLDCVDPKMRMVIYKYGKISAFVSVLDAFVLKVDLYHPFEPYLTNIGVDDGQNDSQ
jgi:serine/threonine protein kinase